MRLGSSTGKGRGWMEGVLRPRFGRPPYWLVTRREASGLRALVLEGAGGETVLPLFGDEAGALEFSRSRPQEEGWQARSSGGGELISLLCATHAALVALDATPEMVSDGTISLVSLAREGFVDSLLGRGRGWFHDGYHSERSRRRSLAG